MVSIPPQAKRVRYVYIPADTHEEMRELEEEVVEGREVEGLLDRMKAHFRQSGGEKTEEQRRAHREQLMQQVGADAAAKLSDQLLSTALDIQMVESVPLLSNSPDSGFVAVNLYCDDQAQIKQLPLNVRASQIADCCGRPTEVRGDAFLGRIFDNEDHFVRMDLELGEVGSGAPWVRQAAQQAARRMREGDRAKDFMDKLQQGKKGSSTTVRELSPAEAAKEAGNAAFKKGDMAAAAGHYSEALAADPHLLPALNNRALAYLKLGEPSKAEEDCCKVLELDPRNAKALLRRAAARVALSRPEEAVADLRAVLQLEPHNKEAAAELTKLQPLPQGDGGAAGAGPDSDSISAAAAVAEAPPAPVPEGAGADAAPGQPQQHGSSELQQQQQGLGGQAMDADEGR